MEKHITELIKNNVRVVLPDLGAFIVKQRKPLRIIFNEFLKYNDGLLIEYVAKMENKNKNEVGKEISEYVGQLKEKLNNNEKIVFKDFGVLSKDPAGNIGFELDTETVLLASGTPEPEAPEKTEPKKAAPQKTKEAVAKQEKKEEVHLEKTEEKKTEKAPAPPPSVTATQQNKQTTTTAKPTPSPYSSRYMKDPDSNEKKRAMLWLAAALLAIIIIVLTIYINRSSKEDADELVSKPDEEVTIPETTDDVQAIEEEPIMDPQITENLQTVSKPSSGKKYYIIAGCFKVPGNADNYVAELRQKGYQAEKLGVFNGYHVVSFNSFTNRSEAVSQLQEIRNTIEEKAWIKRY
jgi:nucleoid DNA-binding protein